MSQLGYTLNYDNKDDLPDVRSFADVDFPEELIRNLAECGTIKPNGLQQDILKLMHKKISILGNVSVNSGGEEAALAYTVAACVNSKKDGTFKSEQFMPFAIYIVGTDYMLNKFYGIANALAKGSDVTVVKGSLIDFGDERKCELAFEKCDIAILAADSFYKYVYDDLVDVKNLKILAVQNLDWINDTPRMERFKNLFKDMEFPKVGNRTILFFDDYYITVAEEILMDDEKAFIAYGEAKRPASKSILSRPQFINKIQPSIEEEAAEDERAARGHAKHIFEIVPKNERKVAIVQRLKKVLEESGGDKAKFPRTIIFVENEPEAQDLYSLIIGTLKIATTTLNCVKLTKNVKQTLENFDASGQPRILIVYNKGHGIVFNKIDHYIFLNCTSKVEYFAQMNRDEKPLTIMSLCSHRDVKKLENIQKILKKYNLPVDDVATMIEELTPLYKEDPGELDDDDFFY